MTFVMTAEQKEKLRKARQEAFGLKFNESQLDFLVKIEAILEPTLTREQVLKKYAEPKNYSEGRVKMNEWTNIGLELAGKKQ